MYQYIGGLWLQPNELLNTAILRSDGPFSPLLSTAARSMIVVNLFYFYMLIPATHFHFFS